MDDVVLELSYAFPTCCSEAFGAYISSLFDMMPGSQEPIGEPVTYDPHLIYVLLSEYNFFVDDSLLQERNEASVDCFASNDRCPNRGGVVTAEEEDAPS